jgi:hypothetical protein
MSESIGHSRYDPFINAMGLEMVCKGYLLALKRSEYEGWGETQAREKVNKLAKEMGHKVTDVVQEIGENIGQDKVQLLLDKKYDVIDENVDLTGSIILQAIEAAYLECRYPVPNPFYREFPVFSLKDAYWDPLYSSGLPEFCYEFCRIILTDLKAKFGIEIPKSWWNQKIRDDAGQRFGNLFFGSRKEDFIF